MNEYYIEIDAGGHSVDVRLKAKNLGQVGNQGILVDGVQIDFGSEISFITSRPAGIVEAMFRRVDEDRAAGGVA